MTLLASPGKSAALRARRWDIVVLGSALPGLVAAAYLAKRGLRVLVIEEEAAARLFPGFHEPFLLLGGEGSVLNLCFQELMLPLIERRALERDATAFQLVLPEARINFGEPTLTSSELAGWGLCTADAAEELVRALARAGAAERAAMLDAPVVRSGRLRTLARGGAPRAARRERGLPVEITSPPPSLEPLFAAQLRALSHLGDAPMPPEGFARLVGGPLESPALSPTTGCFVHELLRRRIKALHGEFRAVSRRFQLIEVNSQPGIAVEKATEVWVGRALIINAPKRALADFLRGADGADSPLLQVSEPTHRCVALHYRIRCDLIPEGMERRVICVRDLHKAMTGDNVITLQQFPPAEGSRSCDWIARTVVEHTQSAEQAAETAVAAVLRDLLPFSADKLSRVHSAAPVWDDATLLSDPKPGGGWPCDTDIRLASRPPVFHLAREDVAALGSEGELLLGWRAGEVIGAQLG